MKNKKLNQWLWKWHVIAGLISAPFIVLLAITGGIYLFKDTYEKGRKDNVVKVIPSNNIHSYEEQRNVADSILGKPHSAMILSFKDSLATQFISGSFGHKNSVYVNPYTNKIIDIIADTDGAMYNIRKLHGELLLGTAGTLIVELIASWIMVLLITGVFVWWPMRNWRLQGFFVPRLNMGKQVLFRDLHAIIAFWISTLLILVLAGAFPWTEVVGSNFKKVQEITNTGFPKSWMGVGLSEPSKQDPIPLDEIVSKASTLDLPGEVQIDFPKGPAGVYTVGNTYYPDLSSQEKFHYNQYSGELVLHQKWADVGILMRARMWFMAFHQGQFGAWNWWLMLFIAIFLALSSAAAILSYFSKKPKNKWIVPKVPRNFHISNGVILIIILLSLLFPLFGISALIIYVLEKKLIAKS
ncbi:PepSY domain-containing protein [Marixanthomonas sp. SCSIO 43207]|uniref:PepSY-associated TM helix domain-containing protein n=1 Tax=Marixanthomonas sp. SCSIO 43207 TaxID=2779360 RepID=UPI001CA7E1DF|nr:PepSY domain-containing protein [Marixanthomonas sp. SCSIO 43207]UAB82387.1 PepSY domain-containing protein [Marixanthomonas sp. SCSIO 43207]